RIAAIRFSGGIFTNLTQDHLDFHKTFDAYLQAKKTFFDHLPREAFALVNKDDRNGLVMVQNTAATVKTYALRSMADYTCRILSEQIEGMFLNLCGQEVFVRFIGRFNAYNLLAVYGAAVQLGIDPQQLAVIMSQLRPVAGRFEYFTSKKGFTAVVDYAHTPDAIENVLDTIRELAGQSGRRIITVVGAGGDRDRGKRPLMARAAVRRSSLVIFTSDNPRSEKPEDIIADMLAGLSEEERAAALVIPDRREAIRTACLTARAGDVVLVAGKGHEDYQIVNGVKHHFDDREEVAKYI
ncbi:MAG: UDP-N-acetylmuramoyl-L-alanyl-D-glutamate--2,6-diaminopimelate ligase, partial [Bacteroidales bacterium]|nr:UDP-N-acetylmuramoyl-L-alanyl-D-glutamate--2,6-diaminopimelate ligase [Bacteroidales bacterium]